MSEATTALPTAPHVLEYPYSRSVGPVVGKFLGGLKAGVLLGVRTSSGRVLCPPLEYDPDTGESTTGEFVVVGPSGTVETWTWSDPRGGQPLDHPFAWALVKPDGADTALLHAVDAGEESNMSTGMRVTVRWRDERKGHINDIECFEPEGSAS
ncbi:MAG TPA: OB-fold domain-containing protein [Actinomycetota bacterium]|nr:OB-fold domain-containing protein [Actinomycetota bacterium]